MQKLVLNQNWKLKQRDPNLTLPENFASTANWIAATVPGVVQQDLLRENIIPDPFVGLNEQEVQWVGETDWLYQCQFDLSENFLAQSPEIRLCFDGLDTFATVWLNSTQILTSDNMFVPQAVEVKSLLRSGRNTLQVLFESALRCGQEREAQYGKLFRWNSNSSSSRLYVRKAQYHYGWDWGPTLITAGLWKEVRLEAYAARIANLACPVELSADLNQATLSVSLEIEPAETDLQLQLALFNPDGQKIATTEVAVPHGTNEVNYSFQLDKPELWWPNGYGAQPLYRLEAHLVNPTSNVEHDSQTLRLGLRQIRLVQEPLENLEGTSFYFEVNNVPIFCGGANWIPSDSFTPRLNAAAYRHELELAANSNMQMLRVWGGGIYEPDVFYDLCDELGLLVWQDFMFACGIYPAHAWFLESVRAEAEAVVKRLRHHPCLALWCGNNEDYLVAHEQQLYDPNFTTELAKSAFPARAIYEKLLPAVCHQFDPATKYWPGSPYGGNNANSPLEGDRHTWEIWHGPMADYHDYGDYAGRFVSEFGMQSLPAPETIAAFAAPQERFVGSHTLDYHNKASDKFRRIAVYLSDNLPMPQDFEEYVYATQLIQAEAMAAAFRGWRRKWKQPGRYEVGGALLWQLNDCWPVTSWAIVDYFGRPKPAYYVTKRELAALTIGLERKADSPEVTIWLTNSNRQAVEGRLVLQRWTLCGELLAESRQPVTLAANGATELPSLIVQPNLVLAARLELQGHVVARNVLWPEPFKYYQRPDPEIEIVRVEPQQLQLTVKHPAKGVWLAGANGEKLNWSDNMLDLIPDDPQIISVDGLDSLDKLEVRWLGGSREVNLATYVQAPPVFAEVGAN